MTTFKENFMDNVFKPLNDQLYAVVTKISSNRWDKKLRKFELEKIRELFQNLILQIDEAI